MQDAITLYRGDVFTSAAGEHWILAHEISYKYKCLRIHNELMRLFYETQNYVSVEHYASHALKIDPSNMDAYYWRIRSLKKKESSGMVKGELMMAEHVLDADTYFELNQKLERAKELDEITVK